MTKQEFAKFAMALKTYYPKENLLPNNQSMELWFRQLQDLRYILAETALNQWVATNKWSPTIADIRENASTISHGELQDWGSAWEDVLTAIRKYGYYNASEAMESLKKNQMTYDIVKRLGFRELCMSEKIEVERANFRMLYERMSQVEKQQMQLPASLTERIGLIRDGMLMIGNGD